MSERPQNSTRRLPLTVRGLLIFLVMLALFAGLWWFCLHLYGNTALWAGPETDVKSDLVYGEKTYHLAGAVGDYGIASGKFQKAERLGEVKPSGKDALTVTYLVYSVNNAKKELDERYLIVVWGDDKSRVYYLDGEENPYKGEWPTYDESEEE